MKLIILFYFVVFYTFNSQATNVRVIDLNLIVDNNKDLVLLISNIEEDQLIHKKKFNDIEINFQSKLSKLDDLKLILNEEEFQKEVTLYNIELKEYNNQIEKFNIHYESQIDILKNKIFDKILKILKKYSTDNQIDLILDSNNYILSSNSINITNSILKLLNNTNFDTNFEKFK